MIRTGYIWNAWGKRYPGTTDMLGSNWDFAFKTLSSMDSDKPLVVDHPLFPWATTVHTAKGQPTPTFNVAFGDAHVEAFTPAAVYQEVLLTNWGGVLTNWAENAGPNNDWAEAFEIMGRG